MRTRVLAGMAGLLVLAAIATALLVGRPAGREQASSPVAPVSPGAPPPNVTGNSGNSNAATAAETHRHDTVSDGDAPGESAGRLGTDQGRDDSARAPTGQPSDVRGVDPVEQLPTPAPTIKRVSAEAIAERESAGKLPYGVPLPQSEYIEMFSTRPSAPLEGGPEIWRARHRYALGFNGWAGRDSGMLGGYRFDLSDYPVLQVHAFEIRKDTLDCGTGTRRNFELLSGDWRLRFTIHIEPKAGWAHEALLSIPGMYTSALLDAPDRRNWFRGDEVNRPLGDVSLWSDSDAKSERPWRVCFTRNNVFIDVRAMHNGPGQRPDPPLDLYALAREMDRQILAQAVYAADINQLLEARAPRVLRFWIEPETPRAGDALIHLKTEPGPHLDRVGGNLHLVFKSRGNTLNFGRLEGRNFIGDQHKPELIRIRPGTGKTEHTVVVSVVGEDLLWTVAEATFTAPEVKLPYDPNARPEPPWRTK